MRLTRLYFDLPVNSPVDGIKCPAIILFTMYILTKLNWLNEEKTHLCPSCPQSKLTTKCDDVNGTVGKLLFHACILLGVQVHFFPPYLSFRLCSPQSLMASIPHGTTLTASSRSSPW